MRPPDPNWPTPYRPWLLTDEQRSRAPMRPEEMAGQVAYYADCLRCMAIVSLEEIARHIGRPQLTDAEFRIYKDFAEAAENET